MLVAFLGRKGKERRKGSGGWLVKAAESTITVDQTPGG